MAKADIDTPLTSGSVGLEVEFVFSEDWSGLTKTAVFETSSFYKETAPLSTASTIVPADVMAWEDETLYIGVYGTAQNGEIVIPTVYASCGRIYKGANDSEGGRPLIPAQSDILQNQIDSLGERVAWIEATGGGGGGAGVLLDTTLTQSGKAADAKAVGDALDELEAKIGEGGSGGITEETDPTVPAWAKEATKPTYTAAEVGAMASDAPVVKTVNGTAPDASGNVNVTGNGGADGVSATHEWNGTVLTITSASGTSSADLKGAKGDKGDKGDPGADGKTPVRGVDYWTSADKQEIVDEVLENVPSGGGGGGDAIVDVIELPTENINEDVFYRLLTGSIIFNGESFSGWVCHCVASLPETGEMVYDGTNAVVYYNQQDGVGYGYVPNAMGSQMGIPAGWYPLDALAPGLGLAYGGAVTTADGTADDTVYILLEYVLYSYKEAWSPVAPDVDVIGWRGEGHGAEVFNDDWNIASGSFSHAEGSETAAIGKYAHAEGEKTVAYGERSHAEGANTLALGECSHAEGFTPGGYTHVSGDAGATTYYLNDGAAGEHAVSTFIRVGSVVTKIVAVDQENWTITVEETLSADKPLNNEVAYTYTSGIAAGEGSHAEGVGTFAFGDGSHAEGYESNASGWNAHAEGKQSFAGGEASHAEGDNTIAASNTQHVQGRWNTEDVDGRYAHIVGNGTDPVRSNAHTVDWNGVGWFAGGLKVGGTSQDDGASVLTEADIDRIAQAVIAVLPNAEGASF
jgi:hypothetical protein